MNRRENSSVKSDNQAILKLSLIHPSEKSSLTTAQVMLRELLSKTAYNVTGIAEVLNVSKASISRLLNGMVKTPNGATFDKLLSLYCRVICQNSH